jgi:hypothetical protein
MRVMHSSLLIVTALTTHVTSRACGGQVEEPPEARRFRDDYATAVPRLRAFYSSIRMEGTADNQDAGLWIAWKYAASNDLMKLEEVDSRSSDGEARSLSASVVGPQAILLLSRDDKTRPYRVERTAPVSRADTAAFAQSTIMRLALPAWASHSVIGMPVSELLATPGFVITGSDRRDENGREILRVTFKLTSPPQPETEGWIDFLPESAWVVLGCEMTATVKDAKGVDMRIGRHSEVVYEGEADGLPLVKRLLMWTSGPAGRSKGQIYEVSRLTPGVVPTSEFTPEAFGIRTEPAPRPIPIAWYLGGLSLLCASMGALFWWLQRRSASMA